MSSKPQRARDQAGDSSPTAAGSSGSGSGSSPTAAAAAAGSPAASIPPAGVATAGDAAAVSPAPSESAAATTGGSSAPAAAVSGPTPPAAAAVSVDTKLPPPPAVAPPPPAGPPPPVVPPEPPVAATPAITPTPITVPAADGAALAVTGAAAAAVAAGGATASSTAGSAAPLSSIDTSGDSKLGLIHGHHSAQGIRPTMEDEVVMFDHIQLSAAAKLQGITSPIAFYGVFDGHGGRKAAEYTKVHLVRNLIAALESGLDPPAALTAAFVKTDSDFIALCGADTSGTTAVTLLVEQSTRKFWCANAGDSRCVLCRKGAAKALSIDHKADRPDELDRIRKAGGFVIHKRVMGELAISRAIGDKDFKAQDFKLVIAEPEIIADTLSEGDGFVVIACDGLYDVMTNDQITTYVSEQLKVIARKSATAAGSPKSPTAATAAAPSPSATATAASASAAAPSSPSSAAASASVAAPVTPSSSSATAAAAASSSTTAAATGDAHHSGDPLLDGVCTRMVTRAIDELHTRDNVSAIVIKLK